MVDGSASDSNQTFHYELIVWLVQCSFILRCSISCRGYMLSEVMVVNNKYGGMWKKTVVVYSKVLYRHLSYITEERCKVRKYYAMKTIGEWRYSSTHSFHHGTRWR
jgi:hypothetical protein